MPKVIRRIFTLFHDQSAVAAIEFAIVGPFLFVLFLAVINLGDLAWTYSTLHDATSVAARYASVQESVLSNASPPSCVATSSIQSVFNQSVEGPISEMPSISVFWGGELTRCNPSGASPPNQSLMPPSLPGGDVLVTTQYAWEPIAMAGVFPTIDIKTNDIEPVIQAKS